LEVTNLGPVMDEAVLRAKRRMRIGADRNYDLLYENFDVLHYLLQSPALIDDPEGAPRGTSLIPLRASSAWLPSSDCRRSSSQTC
jgi:hypothetical protein